MGVLTVVGVLGDVGLLLPHPHAARRQLAADLQAQRVPRRLVGEDLEHSAIGVSNAAQREKSLTSGRVHQVGEASQPWDGACGLHVTPCAHGLVSQAVLLSSRGQLVVGRGNVSKDPGWELPVLRAV